jgi:SAM-dependent methyltransferase
MRITGIHQEISIMESTMDLLCSCYKHNPKYRKSVLEPQFAHRLNLCSLWEIKSGSEVLDIGCGQGDSVVVLAHVVGPAGHVTGIDPAPPDYGSPTTLGESQAYVAASELGSRIDFARADAPAFLAAEVEGRKRERMLDVATMCHSLWYFSTKQKVSGLFFALAEAKIKRVCFAEYTGTARTPNQLPHELAARVQVLSHRLKKAEGSTANVREALEPAELVALAKQAGWKVKRQGITEAADGMLDGVWEVQAATDPEFLESVLAEKLDKEQEDEIVGIVKRIKGLVDELKIRGARVVTMDVAWVVLEL